MTTTTTRKTDRMAAARAAVAAHIAGANRPKMVATICRNDHGLWWVRCTGAGYPKELYLNDAALLVQLRNDGYALHDPLHYVERYGITELMEEASDPADDAGLGWHSVAAEGRDYGHEQEG